MPTRLIYLTSTAIIAIVLAASFYLQLHDGFVPCPLCILQRGAFIVLGACFFLGLLTYRMRLLRSLFLFLAWLSTIAGMVLSGRQVWLQQFHPGDAGECGVSLQYMLHVLPLNEVMAKIFAGSAECSKRGFEFLWLNMAEWSLLIFTLFFIVCIYLFAANKTTSSGS